MKKIIVIGASAASVSFIAKVRSFDTHSSIVCYTAESSLPYNRCLLADFVQLDKQFEDLRLKSENFFQEHAVTLHLNSWVSAIDAEHKRITVAGQEESYDILFIGTGTSPFIPAIEGVDLPGVFVFHTFDAVAHLDEFIKNMMPKNVVVIGAGINGIEAVSSLVARGLHVTVVDQGHYVMANQVDKTNAQYIQNLMKDAGVTFMQGQRVIGIQTRNKQVVGKVHFASGAYLPTDCVVLATGSRVQTSLGASAGLTMHEGSLLVNQAMQTSDPSIYAGGDVCAAQDIISRQITKSATWSDAMLQGLTAATQLSATPRTYPGIVGMRDSEFFGVEFYACGQTVDVDVFEVIEQKAQDYMHTFYLFDNQLKGFVLIGNVENLAKYRTFYLTQQLVDESDFI